MSLNRGKFRFHSFVLDADEGILSKEGAPTPLSPKALKLLFVLVSNRGRIVEKDQLMDQVWGDTFVEEGNLAYTIRLLRKTLGDDAGSPRFIENIPRRGYRFIAEVTDLRTEEKQHEIIDPVLNGSPTSEAVSRVRGSGAALSAPAVAERRHEEHFEAPEPSAAILKFPTPTERRGQLEEVTKVRALRGRRAVLLLAAVLFVAGAIVLGGYFFSQQNISDVEKRSIAVLPFVNESGNPEIEYLSDGISESLINSLSELKQLKVIARTTAFRYKDRQNDLRDVGRELIVDTVLTGKITLLGDNLVVQVDLIDVANGAQVWGERYTRKLANLVEVQDAISREIVSRLQPRISRDGSTQLAGQQTDNSRAYQALLKAQYLRGRTKAELITRLSHADEAIAEDPNYAAAYAYKALTYDLMGWYAFLPPKEAFPEAKRAAEKALELNEKTPEAYNALAYVSLYYEWDFAKAEREWLRAIELRPNYGLARQWYANMLTAAGRWDEAIHQLTVARENDPASPAIIAVPGWTYYYAREYDKAIEPNTRAIEFDQTFVYAHVWLGQALERKGEYGKAIAEFQTAVNRQEGAPEPVALLAHAYAVSGDQQRARAILADLIAQSKDRYVSPYHIATVYVGLNDREQALEWLETAYKERQYVLVFLRHDPRLDDLRADPRFQDLLNRIKIP